MSVVQKARKIRWNKSQLIESDTYIKVFVKSLSRDFSASERQEVYYISKLYVDGTVEIANAHFKSAEFYFNKADTYLNRINDGTIKKKLLENIRDRSKSLFCYRRKDYKQAIDLINHALKTNKELEAEGFQFMIFDRASQYHNLAKIYFSQNLIEEGLAVLKGVLTFLITLQSNEYIDSAKNLSETLDEEEYSMRSSLICLLFYETIGNFQKQKSFELFVEKSYPFFKHIFDASENFHLHTKADACIKEWITTVGFFYDEDFKKFTKESMQYLRSNYLFYGNIPNDLLYRYLNYLGYSLS